MSIIYGTNGDDTLWDRDTEYTQVFGLDGNDWINGGGKAYLSGGKGDDTVHGTQGELTILGDEGDDYLSLVNGRNGSQVYGGDGDDHIWIDNTGVRYGEDSFPSIYVSGGKGNDRIWRRGASGGDTIAGGAGDDTILIMHKGTLRGGQDNDVYVLSYHASVSIVERANEGIDEVQSEQTFTLSNHVENLTLLSRKSDIWHSGGSLPDVDFDGYGNNLGNTITGNIGNNTLAGKAGDDVLGGNDGRDRLVGGAGSDSTMGGRDDDILIGTDDFKVGGAVDKGVGSIDELTGGGGRDRFILGEHGHVFYDDGISNSFGSGDYALITDFKGKVDTIQLRGKASHYVLGSASAFGVSGVAIYLRTPNLFSNELVAVVQGSSNLDLKAGYFDYVA